MTDNIERLVGAMPGTRGLLFGIMEFCREAKEPAQVDAYVTEQLQFYTSVHSPVEFRSFLEKAGALDFLPAEAPEDGADELEEAGTDGQRDSDDATGGTDAAEEKVYATDFPVDEDGFLIPAPERAGLWQTSEQGRAYLAGIDYQKRFDELLSADPPLSGIYYLILELCSDEPQSIDELDAQLKAPLAAVGSKKHAGFFVELLEGYDALKWEKKWKTTTVGRELLAARKEE